MVASRAQRNRRTQPLLHPLAGTRQPRGTQTGTRAPAARRRCGAARRACRRSASCRRRGSRGSHSGTCCTARLAGRSESTGRRTSAPARPISKRRRPCVAIRTGMISTSAEYAGGFGRKGTHESPWPCAPTSAAEEATRRICSTTLSSSRRRKSTASRSCASALTLAMSAASLSSARDPLRSTKTMREAARARRRRAPPTLRQARGARRRGRR